MRRPRIALKMLMPVLFFWVTLAPLGWGEGTPAGWYEGAAGYRHAYMAHKETGKPLLVYFYAPWCGYCRQFNHTLMVDTGVENALDDYIKVRIYPEESRAGQWLAKKLQIGGYPSLKVWYYHSCTADITPFSYSNTANDWVMDTPDGFIKKIVHACDQ